MIHFCEAFFSFSANLVCWTHQNYDDCFMDTWNITRTFNYLSLDDFNAWEFLRISIKRALDSQQSATKNFSSLGILDHKFDRHCCTFCWWSSKFSALLISICEHFVTWSVEIMTISSAVNRRDFRWNISRVDKLFVIIFMFQLLFQFCIFFCFTFSPANRSSSLFY